MSYSQDNDSSNWPIITYPFEYLDKLRRMGFKAIFHPSQMMNLLKLVCWLLRKCEEDLSTRSFCRYFYHSNDYWTPERLIEWTPSFHGIRVIDGKTYIYTNDGQKMGPFRLYQLDSDSVGAYNLIKQYLETYLLKYTFVIKSRKDYWYHVYWLEDWNDNQDDCIIIKGDDCKIDYEFASLE